MSESAVPRGIRNNNPGNVRRGGQWLGLARVQSDPSFCVFSDPAYGIRALGLILLTYQARHERRSIRQIITRWAPPAENDTEAYIAHVAAACGIGAETEIFLARNPPLLCKLVRAIIKHENGQCPYDDALIEDGVSLALSGSA